MLEATLATPFLPGSNLKGAVVGAGWRFALPSLDRQKRILCLGRPPRATLGGLGGLAGEIVVVPGGPLADRLRSVRDLENVRLLPTADGNLPLQDGSVDLVIVASRHWARRLSHERPLSAELRRVLRAGGLCYADVPGARRPNSVRLEQWAQALGLGGFEHLWVAPRRGEVESLAPLAHAPAVAHLRGHEAAAARGGRAARGLVRRTFERTVEQRLPRRAVLLGQHSDGPPAYLRSIAAEAGVPLDGFRWGLHVSRGYESRKVLFFLFDGDRRPRYVAKMTRHPSFNGRLENEWRALQTLAARGLGDGELVPRPVFFGYHGGLAVLGQTAIEGRPFRRETAATPDCPYARAAIGFLVELGTSTADLARGGAGRAGKLLEFLLGRFLELYRLGAEHRDFLSAQVEALSRSAEPLPAVFQHGDPGAWNVVVTPARRPAFLDWEAAEPRGMPLWDLFHFTRSFAVTVGRAAGKRDAIAAFRTQLLAPGSRIADLCTAAAARICAGTGLSRALVEPLFYTCWMHRALKEANRLRPSALDRGHYVNLLRLCIDGRGTPSLERLFSAGSSQKPRGRSE